MMVDWYFVVTFVYLQMDTVGRMWFTGFLRITGLLLRVSGEMHLVMVRNQTSNEEAE